MPQIFQVLRCYQCNVFQVHPTKKIAKFQCKMCGEKQSIKRHHGLGTALECRQHVQKLNGIRGEIDELKEQVDDNEEEELPPIVDNKKQGRSVSKWSNYVDTSETLETCQTDTDTLLEISEDKYVLEVPTKKRKIRNKCKIKTTTKSTEDLHDNYECNVNKPDKCNSLLLGNELSNNTDFPCELPKTKVPKRYIPPMISNSTSTNKINEQNETSDKDQLYNSKNHINVKSKWAAYVNYIDEIPIENVPPASSNEFESDVNGDKHDADSNIDFDEPSNEVCYTSGILKSSDNNSYKNDLANKSPRWDNFINVDNLFPTQNVSEGTTKITAPDLFALCDDSNIDDILDF